MTFREDKVRSQEKNEENRRKENLRKKMLVLCELNEVSVPFDCCHNIHERML